MEYASNQYFMNIKFMLHIISMYTLSDPGNSSNLIG